MQQPFIPSLPSTAFQMNGATYYVQQGIVYDQTFAPVPPSLAAPAVQTASPVTGAVVTILNGSNNILLVLTPLGTLSTLTVTLPSDGSTVVGQMITVFCTQIITTLTINGATTIYNGPTSFAVGGKFTLQKMSANTWA